MHNKIMSEKLKCEPAHAKLFAGWIATRGGVLTWESKDLSNPNRSMSTPARTQDGNPCPSPHWIFGQTPASHVIGLDEVEVYSHEDVKTFDVKLKISGHQIVLSKSSEKKVHEALHQYPGSWFIFESTGCGIGELAHGLTVGHDTVIIRRESGSVPLEQWLKDHS